MFNINFAETGFKPWTYGIGSDRSTNWATTTAQNIFGIQLVLNYEKYP